jgi:hypothetical protein
LSCPIVIRLREINRQHDAHQPILERLRDILGLQIQSIEQKPGAKRPPERPREREELMNRALFGLLDALRPLIILDGFDEIIDHDMRDLGVAVPAGAPLTRLRARVLDDIRALALRLERAQVVVTSRSADFMFTVDNMRQYEIRPLRLNQISLFATRWLGTSKADKFVRELSESPYRDTLLRPLAIAHLCAIFERVGKIPDKPKTIYRKLVHLLLEEWDAQRSVQRLSRYGSFEIDRKFEFLCALAFHLTTTLGRTVFSRNHLEKAYAALCGEFGLPATESQQVVNELETHTGLFVQSGYESFEFAHKSLQEYLTAEYLVRLPIIFPGVAWIPNELAVAVAISSSAADYLAAVVHDLICRDEVHTRNEGFLPNFIARLRVEQPELGTIKGVLWLAVLYSVYMERSLAADSLTPGDQVRRSLVGLLRDAIANGVVFRDALMDYAPVADVGGGGSLSVMRKQTQEKNLPVRLYCERELLE